MNDSNNVTVTGNLTRDPELRFTASGQARTLFGIAVNRSWRNRQTQEWEEATSFFNIVAWGEMGENAAQSLAKGTRVIVTGRLEQRSWETDNNEKRSIVEIVADDIAPSLRFATAEITKTERRGGGDFSGGGGASSRPVDNAPPDTSYPDEEPF